MPAPFVITGTFVHPDNAPLAGITIEFRPKDELPKASDAGKLIVPYSPVLAIVLDSNGSLPAATGLLAGNYQVSVDGAFCFDITIPADTGTDDIKNLLA